MFSLHCRFVVRNIFSCAEAQPDIAGWSSLVARRAHNPEVVGSNPAPATKNFTPELVKRFRRFLLSAVQDGRPCRYPCRYQRKLFLAGKQLVSGLH